MSRNLNKIGSLLIITMILFLSTTIYSGAQEEDKSREIPLLVMEKVTDFFSGDNFKILEDSKERIEELTDAIGRGSERIGESIEKLTDFIGFNNRDSDEDNKEMENEGPEENNSAGQVVGTVKTKGGEPVENLRMNLGNYATYTNNKGDFTFDNIPHGAYTLSYQESQSEARKNIEEILIDSDNQRYVFSLVLDSGDDGAVLSETEDPGETVLDPESETAPEDQGIENENEGRNILLYLLLLFLALLAMAVFFAINRKHIKIIDGRTGESLGKKKVDIKQVTWIDLTEEFQQASQEKIRIRFIRSAIRKLYGKKVVFTMDDKIIAEIPDYTGELDFLVQKKSVVQGNKDLEEGRD